MQSGMIGLGRMRVNMVRQLLGRGHSCVVFDRSPELAGHLEMRSEKSEAA
jgi:6-phosphogluconate dehydrogenase